VTIREQRHWKTRDKASWIKNSCVTYGVEVVKKHGTEETEKRKREEQRK